MRDYFATHANYGPILVVDIVGFSAHGDDYTTVGMIDALEREVRRFFPVVHWHSGYPYPDRDENRRPSDYTDASPTYVATGDGFILAYPWPYGDDISNAKPEFRVAMRRPLVEAMLGLAVHLYKYCGEWAWMGEDAPFGIRAGLHIGCFYRKLDANGNENIIGAAVTKAQRVVERAGGGRHFLLSEDAFAILQQDFCPTEHGDTWRFDGLARDIRTRCDEWHVPHDRRKLDEQQIVWARACEPWHDKHGNPHATFSVYTEQGAIGDPVAPSGGR